MISSLLFRSSPTNGTSPSSLNSRKSSFNCDSDHDTSNDHMSLEDDVFDLTQKVFIKHNMIKIWILMCLLSFW